MSTETNLFLSNIYIYIYILIIVKIAGYNRKENKKLLFSAFAMRGQTAKGGPKPLSLPSLPSAIPPLP